MSELGTKHTKPPNSRKALFGFVCFVLTCVSWSDGRAATETSCDHQNEELTRDTYVACVQRAADQLRKEGFFSDKTAVSYVEQAKTTDLQPKSRVSQ